MSQLCVAECRGCVTVATRLRWGCAFRSRAEVVPSLCRSRGTALGRRWTEGAPLARLWDGPNTGTVLRSIGRGVALGLELGMTFLPVCVTKRLVLASNTEGSRVVSWAAMFH